MPYTSGQRAERTYEQKELYNKQINNLVSSPNRARTTKSRSMSWDGYVERNIRSGESKISSELVAN